MHPKTIIQHYSVLEPITKRFITPCGIHRKSDPWIGSGNLKEVNCNICLAEMGEGNITVDKGYPSAEISHMFKKVMEPLDTGKLKDPLTKMEEISALFELEGLPELPPNPDFPDYNPVEDSVSIIRLLADLSIEQRDVVLKSVCRFYDVKVV